MKNLFSKLMLMATMAIAFTACEDVPEPYDIPGTGTNKPAVKPDPTGDGTLASPYNVSALLDYVQALDADVESDKDVYVKGKVSKITEEFTAKNGNATFYISDDGSINFQFYAYRVLHLGNKKFVDGGTQIQYGDEVILCGKVVNYQGSTPETVTNKCYVYSINGNTGSATPPPSKSTAENPYTVEQAIAAATGNEFVKGFIVGFIDGKSLSEGAKFSGTTTTVNTNIILAASADETDISKCMPIQLPTGDIRTKLNLKDNAANYKKEITLYGSIETYFGAVGLKTVTYAILDGVEIGKKPGDDPGTGGAVSVDFKTNGMGDWTISDKNKPSAVDNIWKYNKSYGMVATAYVNKTNYASESWLVSPKYDLSTLTAATLKIHHAINFFSSVDVAKTEAQVMVSTDGGNTWTPLTFTGWPSSLSWTFYDSTADMSAYAGKKDVQLALKYTSTSSKAGTWEVEKISVE